MEEKYSQNVGEEYNIGQILPKFTFTLQQISYCFLKQRWRSYCTLSIMVNLSPPFGLRTNWLLYRFFFVLVWSNLVILKHEQWSKAKKISKEVNWNWTHIFLVIMLQGRRFSFDLSLPVVQWIWTSRDKSLTVWDWNVGDVLLALHGVWWKRMAEMAPLGIALVLGIFLFFFMMIICR